MRLYYIFTADSGYDLSKINDYKFCGSVKLGYVIIRFKESELDNVIDYYGEYLRKSIYLNYKFNGYVFFGSDSGFYKYSDGHLVKINSYGFKILISLIYLSFIKNKMYLKSLRNTEHRSLQFDKSTIINNFSISLYKPFEFYCKEHNIAFKYRMKKAKSADKPLVIYLAGGCKYRS